MHSRKHKTLDTASKEFWDFSFVELGTYDLPAMIGLALEMSGNEKVAYIGHSQGTSQMFYALTENKELESQLSMFIALAPVTQMNHGRETWLGIIAEHKDAILTTFDLLGVYSIFTEPVKDHTACVILPFLCHVNSHLYVASTEQFNDPETVMLNRATFPSGMSIK